MTGEPKTTKKEESAPAVPRRDDASGPRAGSYYYDDAHGYQDYEPGVECEEVEKEDAEKVQEA